MWTVRRLKRSETSSTRRRGGVRWGARKGAKRPERGAPSRAPTSSGAKRRLDPNQQSRIDKVGPVAGAA